MGELMPRFRVRRQQDAFVEYVAEVEAPDAQAAADAAYEHPDQYKWEREGVSQYDACRVVALDDDDQEIESTVRGKF